VPIAPGGSQDDPPLYSAEDAARISFGVFIDPELSGDAEDYLHQRAQLCLASYGVQVYAVGDESANANILQTGPDGTARLDSAQLKPGTEYGWRIIAALQDGSQVLSTPLFFKVSASADSGAATQAVTTDLDQRPATPPEQSIALLQHLNVEQSREAAALQAYLSRTLVFETYPTASDSYICAPIQDGGVVPLPAQQRSGLVPTQILPLLGTLMQQAEVVQEALRTDEPAGEKLDALLTQLGDLLGSVSYGRALSGRAPGLSGILARLNAAKADPEQTVALLSELRLSLDSAIGFGSINLRQDYKDAFTAYAEMADERLSIAGSWNTLQPLFGTDEATKVLNIVNDQRGALALLRDEVGKGRLSKMQLAQRLSAQRTRADQASFVNYELADGTTCELVGTPKNVDEGKLNQEQYRCRLAHLLVSVWPD
jgi:hypothetical protein